MVIKEALQLAFASRPHFVAANHPLPPFLSSLPSRSSSGGLDEKCTEEMLHAAFIPFGDIVEVNIPRDFKESE